MNCSTFAINSKCISCDVFFSSGYAAFIHHSMLFKCIFWSTCCSSFYLLTAQYNKMKQRHLKKWKDHSKLAMTMYVRRTQNSLYLYWAPKFIFFVQIYEKIRCVYQRTWPTLKLESICSTQCHTLFWAFQKTEICDLSKKVPRLSSLKNK